jgi:DNA-binding Lrp family transcriptional regulator
LRRPILDKHGSPPIDELDRRVLDRLRVDGRESNRSLAGRLGVSEATVAARLRRLESEDMIRVVALTDMESCGYEYMGFVMVRVGDRSPLEVAPQIALLPETISVVVATGRFDIHATVLARDRGELARIVGEAIPAIPGVATVRCQLAIDAVRYEQQWAALRANGTDSAPAPHPYGVDDLDLRIIRALQRDARISNRRIAATVGVSEGTIRGRVRRMESDGLIRIRAISDLETFGLLSSAFVGVNVHGGDIATVATALVEIPEALIIVRTLGEFDFLLVVAAGSREELIDVLLARISRIDGVAATETMETCAVLKHVYTWARVL